VQRQGIAAPIALRFIPIALSAALFYFLTVGGTFVGELAGWPRIVNSVVGGVLIVVYLVRAPARNDRVDRAVVLSLVLFSLAGVASTFPRQSLDALLGSLAFAAAFYVGRDVTGTPAGSRVLITTLRLLSVIVTALLVAQVAAVNIEWVQLTDGLLPPIGLEFDGRPFGHPYDLVTLAVMLFPSWLVGKRSAPRNVVAAVIGVPLAMMVILAGSRAVWLSVALATLLIAVPVGIRLLRREIKVDPRVLIAAGLAILIGAVVLADPFVDRLVTTSTLDQRVEMWGTATEVWLDRPVTGHGPGSFPWLLQTTDHFDGNSIHPRHPDSALFQLLPEAGLLGLGAALVLLGGVGTALLAGPKPAVWAVAVFVFGGIGANPTDFPFLIATALAWAAYAMPRSSQPPVVVRPRPVMRWLSTAAFAVVAIAVTSALVGGIRYDNAVARVDAGDLPGARRELDAAMALDPGMAIYARQRGIINLQLSEPAEAIADLRRATALNPNDDLSWRGLALAQRTAGEDEAARVSLDRALALQRSDVTNLLLSAVWHREDNELASYERDAIDIVLGWPTVIAAPGWNAINGDHRATLQVVDAAIERWMDGGDPPVPIRTQPLLLALMGHRSDVAPMAEASSGLSPALTSAMRAVYWCESDASIELSNVPEADRRSSLYWALRLQHSAATGSVDPTALRLYQQAAGRLTAASMDARLEPLQENNPQGSVDAWGYRRIPISWRSQDWTLPSPQAGAARWLLDPDVARAAIGNPAASASCD
jgi:O-antigen ligase/tetratricopeptide (TPR) repeat protein